MTVPVLYPPTLKPTPTERCVAAMFGADDTIPALGTLGPFAAGSPREVIEAQLVDALQAGPCFVSFSGGRDSSALLAIAVSVARREGLPDPVPLTTMFAHLPESNEEDFQRVVIEHLGVREWHRVDGGEELDVIGPYAQRVLRSCGLVLPINSHALIPLMETASGGTLVTGAGGDELLSNEVYRLSSALLSRRRINRRTLGPLAMHDAPHPMRRRWLRDESALQGFAWLTPGAREALIQAHVEESLSMPVRFDRLLELTWRNRGIQSLVASPVTLASAYGTTMLQPFLTAEFMAAMAREWGGRFPGWRTGMLRTLVGDLLPDAILTRESKAEFARAFYTERTREWVRSWDRTGLDPALVDADQLAAEWANEFPNGCTLTLLQEAWLAANPAQVGGP